MNEPLTLMVTGLFGGILGAVFFGGLWWTIRKGVASAQPAFWFLGSLLVRMSIVLAGFYVVGHEHWERLVACLLGLLMARFVVTHLTRPTLETQPASGLEGSDAP